MPLTDQPAPHLSVDAPLAEPLAIGRVVIRYRAQTLGVLPVFGSQALPLSPRIGHIPVTIDGVPWPSGGGERCAADHPGMGRGCACILIERADPTYRVIDRYSVRFVIPKR